MNNGVSLILNIQKSFIVILLCFYVAYARFYTLDQLVDNALKNSVELKLAKKKIEYTELQIQSIYSSIFPRISVSLNANHFQNYSIPYSMLSDYSLYVNNTQSVSNEFDAMKLNVPDYTENNRILFGELVPDNLLQASFKVFQPLYSQGKTYLYLKKARSEQAISVCNYESQKNSIIGRTIKNYYSMLIEQQRNNYCNKCTSILRENHRLTCVNYSHASANEIDTLESLLLLEKANLENKHIESELSKSAESLIVQCGLTDSPGTIQIDDTFPEPVFFITINEALSQLHERNHQIKQFKGAGHIQDYNIRIARSAYLPVIYAGGSANRIGVFSTISHLPEIIWNNDGVVFVGMAWKLFSGFNTQRTVQQQINQYGQLLLLQQKTIDSLELETRTLHADIIIMKEQLLLMKKMVDLMEKKRDATRIAFENGNGTSLELGNVELELQKTILNYSEQLFLFHITVIDFKLLTGCLQGF